MPCINGEIRLHGRTTKAFGKVVSSLGLPRLCISRYVLPNHFLLTLAERPPKEISTLLTLVQPTPPLLRSHASRLIETIQSSVATYSVQELRKAKERADFGAMDIDSGPFANVVRKDSDEEPELEAGALIVELASL